MNVWVSDGGTLRQAVVEKTPTFPSTVYEIMPDGYKCWYRKGMWWTKLSDAKNAVIAKMAVRITVLEEEIAKLKEQAIAIQKVKAK